MKTVDKIKKSIEECLMTAIEQRRKIRKQVEFEAIHESRLDFADGLVAGIETALTAFEE